VVAFGEEGGEPFGELRGRLGRGDADDVEAVAERVGDELRLQKSRLA
jgi:hypothetical protein